MLFAVRCQDCARPVLGHMTCLFLCSILKGLRVVSGCCCCRKQWTPLHVAAHSGTAESVKLLLEHGADVRAVTEYVGLVEYVERFSYDGFYVAVV